MPPACPPPCGLDAPCQLSLRSSYFSVQIGTPDFWRAADDANSALCHRGCTARWTGGQKAARQPLAAGGRTRSPLPGGLQACTSASHIETSKGAYKAAGAALQKPEPRPAQHQDSRQCSSCWTSARPLSLHSGSNSILVSSRPLAAPAQQASNSAERPARPVAPCSP